MLSVARLVSFWRCIPVQYNCQKSSNFQGLSHFSRIFGKNDKIPGFFQAGKTVTIFPGFPGAVGTLVIYMYKLQSLTWEYRRHHRQLRLIQNHRQTLLCFGYRSLLYHLGFRSCPCKSKSNNSKTGGR